MMICVNNTSQVLSSPYYGFTSSWLSGGNATYNAGRSGVVDLMDPPLLLPLQQSGSERSSSSSINSPSSSSSTSSLSPPLCEVLHMNGSLGSSQDPGGGLKGSSSIPRELTFTEDALISVIAYSVLFVMAATGNLTVFIILFKNRRRRSRVNLFIMHLSVADMIVTFVMLPMEIGWHLTVSWQAGDAGCRALMFFRVFGFYLSSFILIAISLDRYFAITHPLSLNDADRRGRLMLVLAWIVSAVASIPQSVIFHVEPHPNFKWFEQCVTFNFFPSAAHELAYNLFNAAAMYIAPLVVIIISYTLILFEMSRKSRESKRQFVKDRSLYRGQSFRRSAIGRIEKARVRTLKMTIVIVMVFLACWTPYFVMSAWWWIDPNSATGVDPKIQRALFIFAVSNSCVNPIVYGLFTTAIQRELSKCCCWFKNFFRIYTRTLTRELKKNLCCQRRAGENVSVSQSSSGKDVFLYTYMAKKMPNSHNEKTTRRNAERFELKSAEDVVGSECQEAASYYVTIPVEVGRACVTSHLGMQQRKMTPPYISEGRGNKNGFDKYLLI